MAPTGPHFKFILTLRTVELVEATLKNKCTGKKSEGMQSKELST